MAYELYLNLKKKTGKKKKGKNKKDIHIPPYKAAAVLRHNVV